MATEKVIRKLAAILHADVAGYSRLISADEEGAHRTVADHLDAIADMVSGHGGRVVNYAGDAVLSDFASVVAAVKCAVEIQKEMAVRNVPVPDERKVQFRIGVNLGDVIVDRGDIIGNGVNVAARLQSLAHPGGICISRKVLDEVKDRIDVGFEDMGQQDVKNIPEPVQAYRVIPEQRPTALPTPPMPDKPSIAVLPFDNLSGDPGQRYFADGVAEDIITGLSRFRWLFVIARNSSFAFKGQAVDVKRVGRELGVRYVLDGSVRRASDRIRVAAQLNDATTGAQIWAERYDRVLEDIFAVQDEITDSIVAAIEPELGHAEQRRAYQKKPEVLDAWDVYQRGAWHLYKRTKENLEKAEGLFERALALDPSLTSALAGLVDAYYYEIVLGLTDRPEDRREKAIVAARQAVELDANDAAAHCAVGKARIVRREHDAAIPELELALEINPSLAWAYYGLGAAAVFSGQSADSTIPHLQRAIRLSPRDFHMGSFMVRLADAYLAAGDYAAAVEWGRKSLRQPNFQWSTLR